MSNVNPGGKLGDSVECIEEGMSRRKVRSSQLVFLMETPGMAAVTSRWSSPWSSSSTSPTDDGGYELDATCATR